MFKMNSVNIPIKTMIQVQKEKYCLKKSGNKNIVTTANKNGDIILLSYNSPKHDELSLAQVIGKDGKQTLTYYRSSEKGYRKPYLKVIETWDKLKDHIVFNKTTYLYYNGTSKIPEKISTTFADNDGGDGVEIVQRFPLEEYSKHFKRPQK